MKKFIVSEDTEVVLDGERYLLEKGDKIVMNETVVKSSPWPESKMIPFSEIEPGQKFFDDERNQWIKRTDDLGADLIDRHGNISFINGKRRIYEFPPDELVEPSYASEEEEYWSKHDHTHSDY